MRTNLLSAIAVGCVLGDSNLPRSSSSIVAKEHDAAAVSAFGLIESLSQLPDISKDVSHSLSRADNDFSSHSSLVQTKAKSKFLETVLSAVSVVSSVATDGGQGLLLLTKAMSSLLLTKLAVILDDEYPYACKCATNPAYTNGTDSSSQYLTTCQTTTSTISVYTCVSDDATTHLPGVAIGSAGVAAVIALSRF